MESTPSPIVEFTGLVMTAPGTLMPYVADRISVAHGDVIAIDSDVPEDGRYLLRILATLEQPDEGHYRFEGAALDLKNHRQCLSVKRRIGYVATDATMISNRTIRENLLLSRIYYENNLAIDIDETLTALCRDAGLVEKLNWRPSELSNEELLKAITIREIGKGPVMMLVDRPENFMIAAEADGIFNHLNNMVQSGMSVVFLSHNSTMTDLANRQMTMTGGEIRTDADKL